MSLHDVLGFVGISLLVGTALVLLWAIIALATYPNHEKLPYEEYYRRLTKWRLLFSPEVFLCIEFTGAIVSLWLLIRK